MKRKYLILLSLSGLILSLDQLTKNYVHSNLTLGAEYPVIEGLFSLVFTRTTGLAFGFFVQTSSSLRELFMIGIPTFALALIVLIFVKLRDYQVLTSFALTLIFAGAIGNLVDRLRYGYVIDFLHFHWKDGVSLPPFNLADLSIIGGLFLVFYSALKRAPKDGGSLA